MFQLETIMKTFDGADDDCEIPLTAGDAREIIQKFSTLRTALRRIRSLEEKNVAKYAREIAGDALDRS